MMGSEFFNFSLIDVLQLIAISLVVWQIRINSRTLEFDRVARRFEMFMRTYDAVTEDEIKDFHAFWDDYLNGNRELYESYYQSDEMRIRRFVGMQYIFEYLAFTFELSERRIYNPIRIRLRTHNQ